jgi:WD40 repeat protein
MGQTSGYRIADYLLHRLRRDRQDADVPGTLWTAVVNDRATAEDLYRVADSARSRGLFDHAFALYKRAALAGDAQAANDLVTLLVELAGHTSPLVALATAIVDGRSVVVTGSRDGTVRVWDLATDECSLVIRPGGPLSHIGDDGGARPPSRGHQLPGRDYPV